MVSPNEFAVRYTTTGPAIAFSTGATGNTSFAKADLHGSKPTNPIASNNPRTLVPQALEDIELGDKTFIVVSNEDDAVNIVVTDAYYRIVK